MADREPTQSGVLHGIYALVVEDDRDARQIVQAFLTDAGAAVTAVRSMKEALSLLRHIEPDVLVTDMLLGLGNGLELLRLARRRGSRAPAIAISAQDFDTRLLQDAGFDAYLRKPLDHRELVKAILTVVRRR